MTNHTINMSLNCHGRDWDERLKRKKRMGRVLFEASLLVTFYFVIQLSFNQYYLSSIMYQALCWMLRIYKRIEYSPCFQDGLQLVIHSDILTLFNKGKKEYIQKLWLVDLNSKNFLCISHFSYHTSSFDI